MYQAPLTLAPQILSRLKVFLSNNFRFNERVMAGIFRGYIHCLTGLEKPDRIVTQAVSPVSLAGHILVVSSCRAALSALSLIVC